MEGGLQIDEVKVSLHSSGLLVGDLLREDENLFPGKGKLGREGRASWELWRGEAAMQGIMIRERGSIL